MNAASEVTGEDVAPADGDVSICFNCGAFYTWEGDAWATLTPEQYAALPRYVRDQLTKARRAMRWLDN
jgi:uncharacterized protein with PIN domain